MHGLYVWRLQPEARQNHGWDKHCGYSGRMAQDQHSGQRGFAATDEFLQGFAEPAQFLRATPHILSASPPRA